MIIVIDTREQLPYRFKTESEPGTLQTCDYSTRGAEDLVAVEPVNEEGKGYGLNKGRNNMTEPWICPRCGTVNAPIAYHCTCRLKDAEQPSLKVRWVEVYSEDRDTPTAIIPGYPECCPSHFKLQQLVCKKWEDVRIADCSEL